MADKGGKSTQVVATSNGDSNNKSFDLNAQLESVANVPISIMKRVNALKNVQLKMLDVESKFYEDLHLLECKYASLFDPLYEKRKSIIAGEYEPNEDEAKWVLDDDLDITTNSDDSKVKDKETDKEKSSGDKGNKETSPSELVKDIKSKVSLNEIGSGAVDVKGVPDFWLQTFRSVELISDMIQEHDEPVLKHLYDVRVRMHDQKPYGYTLEFHFNDNEFFTNKVLTKTYELRTEYDQKDPFSYEGPDLYKCSGCTIDWKKGKNVSVRLVKKKQKHKGHGTIRVITKEVKQDSFFNYFDTIKPSDDKNAKSPASSGTEDSKKASKSDKDNDDESLKDDEGLYAADFEIGHFFKERIIPKAVLYFTGEIADDECYDDYEDDDEDADDDDDSEGDNDDDDDDDEVENQKFDDKKHGGGGKGAAGGKGGNKGGNKQQNSGGDGKNNPPECKQN